MAVCPSKPFQPISIFLSHVIAYPTTFQVLPSMVGSWPCPLIIDLVGKASFYKPENLFGLFIRDKEKKLCLIETCREFNKHVTGETCGSNKIFYIICPLYGGSDLSPIS